MTLVLQTRTKNKEDGRTQVNIFEILFRRLLGLAILRKANFLARACWGSSVKDRESLQ